MGNLHKCSPALLNESTPLHQENPCRLARIFLLQNPLPFDRIFLVLPHSQSFAISSSTDKNSNRSFARLSVWCALRCAFLFMYRVDLGCFLQKTANTLCVSNHLSVLTASKDGRKRVAFAEIVRSGHSKRTRHAVTRAMHGGATAPFV